MLDRALVRIRHIKGHQLARTEVSRLGPLPRRAFTNRFRQAVRPEIGLLGL